MMDDLLLQEVDVDLENLEHEAVDDTDLITSVQVTNEWTNFSNNYRKTCMLNTCSGMLN